LIRGTGPFFYNLDRCRVTVSDSTIDSPYLLAVAVSDVKNSQVIVERNRLGGMIDLWPGNVGTGCSPRAGPSCAGLAPSVWDQSAGYLRPNSRWGRIYELDYEGKDTAGNTATCSATITVRNEGDIRRDQPRSCRRRRGKPVDGDEGHHWIENEQKKGRRNTLLPLGSVV
jgi:hypothetical protein